MSLLGGPLIVGVAVSKGGGTGIGLERCLGVAVRRVGLPAFSGSRRCTPICASSTLACSLPCSPLLAAVIAIKVGAVYAAARMAGFDAADTRASSARSCNAAQS